MAASALTNAPAITAQRTSALRSAVIRDYWALTLAFAMTHRLVGTLMLATAATLTLRANRFGY